MHCIIITFICLGLIACTEAAQLRGSVAIASSTVDNATAIWAEQKATCKANCAGSYSWSSDGGCKCAAPTEINRAKEDISMCKTSCAGTYSWSSDGGCKCT